MSVKKLHADQIDSDADLARRLLVAQFPQWAELPITPVSSGGTENAIYRLGDDKAVRMPYRPGKSKQVDKLEQWLPKLAPQLPLPIPVPIAKGAPTEEFPTTWSVVQWLEGEEATFERLDDPVSAAKTLAGFAAIYFGVDPAD